MIPKDIHNLRKDIIFEAKLKGHNFVFHSTWGLFSPKEIDKGSLMLINQVDIKPTDFTLEMGCGYGPIGLAIAKISPQGKVHMIDKDFVAVDFAKKNAQLNGIQNCDIYLSNAFGNVPAIEFDNIVSNLPAKVGKELLFLILNDAKDHLKKGGKFYVVVIAGLKDYIKRNFKEVFGNYEKLKQGKTYMVAVAIKE
jgi:16S rRNA G1207 methylase RsmC